MSLTKPQLIMIGAAAFVVIVAVLIFTCTIPGLQKCNTSNTTIVKGTISIWGITDSQENYSGVLSNFKTLYPQVDVSYRSFQNADDYRSALLNALAAGTGPDIFMIENNSLPKNIAKLYPAPQTALSLPQLRTLFPQVVEQDFVSGEQIYALPVSIDTLALFYNRDILGKKAIPVPPSTWEEFKSDVQKISEIDATRRINLAAAAIGGSESTVNHASDILSMLMLQTGTQMTSADFTQAMFNSDSGMNALTFYTQFANASANTYTWNDQMQYSLDAFAQGKVAMVFEYAAEISDIKARNSFLNFAIAASPQPANAARPITYPHYWGYTVAKQSRNPSLAWNFIFSFATDPAIVKEFLTKTGKPPALNSLLATYLTDPDLNVFARQALIARSWPEIDPTAISQTFSRMIQSVITGATQPAAALKTAADEVTALMRKGF